MVAPLAILTLCILFSIIEQISRILVEKRVLRRLIRFDSDESIKANIGLDMELADKVWFYATSEPADRRAVREFLWGYLKNGKEKEVDRYQDISRVSQEFDDDPVAYWTYFIDSTKRKRIKKKINKAWQDWSIEQERQKMVVNPLKRKKKADDEETSAGSKVVETNPAEPESVQEEKPKEKKTKSKKAKDSSNSDTQDKK